MFARFEKLIDPYPDAAVRAAPGRLLGFLWQCSRGARRYLALMAVLAAAMGAFEALLFFFLEHVVDWLAMVPPAELWMQAGGAAGWIAAGLAGSFAVACLWAALRYSAIAGNLPMRLRWQFHRVLLEQSLSFFQSEWAGQVAANLSQTAQAACAVWTTAIDMVVYGLVYFTTLAIVLAGMDAWLALPLLAWAALYAAALRFFIPRLARLAQAHAQADTALHGALTDVYANIATVKLFARARHEARAARPAMDQCLGAAQRQLRCVALAEQANHLLSLLLAASSLGFALWLWSRGAVGAGAVAAVAAMILHVQGMAHWLMWEAAALLDHLGAVANGLSLLGATPEVQDRQPARRLVVARGEVRFKNVSFAYGGGKDSGHKGKADKGRGRVLDGIDLHIRPGEKIGLVGRSGAGKTTLLNLLLRLYDLDAGRIAIDGQDIRHVTQDSLRANIGVVAQDTALLHRSVRENIAYGRPAASMEDIRNAAARAGAGQFIADFCDAAGRRGYDACVGERGALLSGGQRQRIVIARAFLKDAPILLLDEATSALDGEAEEAVQAHLGRLMRGRTVIAIAHRLATLLAMDRLVVIDQGRIVEQGKHTELLARQGLYARLWRLQGSQGDGLGAAHLLAA